MGQQILPLFIEGETRINEKIHYEYKKETATIYYYLYCHPLYSHCVNEKISFQLVIAQLIVSGHCRNFEIVNAFGVSSISVKRSVKKYRTGGMSAFFKSRPTRGPKVLTDEVLLEAQELLDEGEARTDAAQKLGIKANTLSKAIQAGKLRQKKNLNMR
jgi:transposase